jgi:chromosome segregation ATPase
MGTDNENEETEVEEPKDDEIIEEVKEDLKDGSLSRDDLIALESKLTAHIKAIQRDSSKDSEEKAELQAKMDKLQERLDHLIEAQEDKEKKHNDESTIIVPPAELNPPTHMNKEEITPENAPENKKPRKGWRKMW